QQAIFDLAAGRCTLKVTRNGKEVAKETRSVNLGTGTHTIQFANFDHRLTLWVDKKLAFDDGLTFQGQDLKQRGPLAADLRPVAIGAKTTALSVRHLRLWRDIYYSQRVQPADVEFVHLRIGNNPEDVAQALSLSQEDIQALAGDANGRPLKWEKYYDQQP